MVSIRKSLKKKIVTQKAKRNGRTSKASSARRQISLGFIAVLTILVVVAVLAVQRVQTFKSEATGTCAEQAARAYDDCIGYGANLAHINVEGYCEQLKNQVNRICSGGSNTGSANTTQNVVSVDVPPSYTACTQEAKTCPDGSSVGRGGPNCDFAPCPSPTGGAVTSGLRVPPATSNCTPIRTAPVILSPVVSNATRTNNVTAGMHSIRWRVAAGQKGGVAVIDDLSNPFKNCNSLNSGDACRVPESKGRTNTVTYNFKRGKKYNIRVATVNCGVVSNLSPRFKVEVAR